MECTAMETGSGVWFEVSTFYTFNANLCIRRSVENRNVIRFNTGCAEAEMEGRVAWSRTGDDVADSAVAVNYVKASGSSLELTHRLHSIITCHTLVVLYETNECVMQCSERLPTKLRHHVCRLCWDFICASDWVIEWKFYKDAYLRPGLFIYRYGLFIISAS